jgi:hypothetical protein
MSADNVSAGGMSNSESRDGEMSSGQVSGGDMTDQDETVGTTTDAADAAAAATPSSAKRRRRAGLIALSVVAILAGVLGSWAYNHGAPTRQDRDTAIIRAGMDPSTYVSPGDYDNMTVPIRNDSPYAVTVIGLYVVSAPKLSWNSAWTVIQPGATANLHLMAPYGCSAIPHTLKHIGAVPVLLRVLTANGNSHASLRTSISGVIQYAADYCAKPTPTPTPTKQKA